MRVIDNVVWNGGDCDQHAANDFEEGKTDGLIRAEWALLRSSARARDWPTRRKSLRILGDVDLRVCGVSMKVSVQPARVGLGAPLQKRRRLPELLAAAGAAMVFVLALAIWALWPRHVAIGGPGLDVSHDAFLAETTPARSGGSGLSPPIHPQASPASEPRAVAPTATNDGSPGGCQESSFRFRKIVAPCFGSENLCNVGVSVRFDGDGRPIDVSFISQVPPAIAEPAREARACVVRSFAELATPCSRSKEVHYTKRCTLR